MAFPTSVSNLPTPVIAQIGGVEIALILLALIVGAVAAVGVLKLLGAQKITAANREASRIVEDARKEGETLKKQIELDARTEQAKARETAEKEFAETRNELKEQERRLAKREDNLDKKLDTLTTKEKYLSDRDDKISAREQAIQGKQEELDELTDQRRKLLAETEEQKKNELLRIANLNEDEAKKQALQALEAQCQQEAGQIVKRMHENIEEQAREHSLKITLQAIQRFAGEHTHESTVSPVQIANDDMKGRVIGREGRNIRAFEKATGADVIVDDTPGTIVVSCFDPVRRAIAAESLQKLLDDGRIHPTRIEEIVEQITEEMSQKITKFGKDAAIEANIQNLHGKISEAMGRLQYRMSYGQNILRHSVEVAYLCQVIADELGLDGALARRCGYLHDIGKAMDHEHEGGHPAIGMEFCRKHGENDIVLNAIGGHHNDIPSISPYTPIVMAADAISGARPGARRETLEKYVKRLEQLEGIANDMKGVSNAYAIQAGREVRVIVNPDKVDDADCNYIAREIAKKVSDEMTFPGEIKVTVLREMRTVDYAR